MMLLYMKKTKPFLPSVQRGWQTGDGLQSSAAFAVIQWKIIKALQQENVLPVAIWFFQEFLHVS